MTALWEGLLTTLALLLDFFYGFVPSYGFGIIILTVVINMLVFPLTLKQTRATRAFQAVQPEIKRIQKEYKDQPEEMQKELMRVQREAGASPGGCLLPLLVQMPIWFALFRTLGPIAVEEGRMLALVRRFLPDVAIGDQVPRILELLPDGSALGAAIAADSATFLGMHMGDSPAQAFGQGLVVAIPYLIMIVIMVATQYVQTWHATYGQEKPEGPQAGAQQAVTKVMPLFIGFISWNFPAGLVLYWATANLFRLGQQVLIFKMDGRPTPAPAAAPAASKSGNGANPVDEPPVKKPQPGSQKKKQQRRRRRN